MNDPVLLRVDEDRFWLALADSDAGLYARGVAVFAGLDVEVSEPHAYPMQIQGPRSKEVMETLFGQESEVMALRYYWCTRAELDGIPVVVSRTGWTGEVGFEIYLLDPDRGDDLWERVMDAGRPYDIRPIAPARPGASRPASSTTTRT